MSNLDAIIKKLSKKIKMGEYDPVEVVDAMNMVEPGWTIKLTTSTMQASSYSNQHDRFEMLWADKLGIPASSDKYDRYFKDVPAGIQPVRVGADDFSISFEKNSMDDGFDKIVKDVLARVSKPLVVGKTLPSKPEVDGLYVAGFKTEMAWTGGISYRVTVQKARLGVLGWLIKSPRGKELVLPVQPKSRDKVGDPHNMSATSLWAWLYKETTIDQKAKAYLETPDVVKKQEREQLLKTVGDKVGKIGTCCVCENHQMLNRNRLDKEGNPTMVLHGYERPGVGYVIGNCFAVGYAPYELSAKGCEAWRDELVTLIANQKRNVSGIKKMVSIQVYLAVVKFSYDNNAEYREGTLRKDGTFTPTSDKTYSRNDLRTLKLRGTEMEEGKGEGLFKSLQAVALFYAESQLKMMERDHKRMVQKIKDWSLQPLPGTSAEDAQISEQMKAKLCPGSGTTNHDNSHTGSYMSQWATCNVCGQKGISVNKSSNKMRAHPPAKVKAMTASMRIDEVAEKLLTFTTPEKIRAAVEEAADLLAKIE